MGGLPAIVLTLSLTVGAPPDSGPAKRPAHPLPGGDLSAEDARYLDALVEEFLFDPRGAVRVRVGGPDGPMRFAIRGDRIVTTGGDGRDGWLVRGRNGQPDRIYFADGESISAAGQSFHQIDFEALCERRYVREPSGEGNLLAVLMY